MTATEWEAPAAEKKDNKKKDAKEAAKPAAKKEEKKPEAKKEAPKKEEVAEEEVPAAESKWNLYDWKTLYTNTPNKEDAIKNLIENTKEGEICIYHLHY